MVAQTLTRASTSTPYSIFPRNFGKLQTFFQQEEPSHEGERGGFQGLPHTSEPSFPSQDPSRGPKAQHPGMAPFRKGGAAFNAGPQAPFGQELSSAPSDRGSAPFMGIPSQILCL